MRTAGSCSALCSPLTWRFQFPHFHFPDQFLYFPWTPLSSLPEIPSLTIPSPQHDDRLFRGRLGAQLLHTSGYLGRERSPWSTGEPPRNPAPWNPARRAEPRTRPKAPAPPLSRQHRVPAALRLSGAGGAFPRGVAPHRAVAVTSRRHDAGTQRGALVSSLPPGRWGRGPGGRCRGGRGCARFRRPRPSSRARGLGALR